jgi:8-oxo-dGTP pyrophosphatase MutT (NUDIX family)
MNQTPCDSHYVGALLLTTDGGVVVQHRDDNPAIHWPDSLSTFGGGVEGDESFDEALAREMKEELDIDINDYAYEFYKTFYQRVARRPEVSGDMDCHIFLIHDVNPEELTVLEGQGYTILTQETDLAQIKASPTMREILAYYFENIDK